MKCPNCNVELSLSERQGIEIDYCPQCRGVWLDRGELDKIIERSAPEAVPARQHAPYPGPAAEGHGDYHRDSYRDEDYYRKKKRRSFLGDLFDFD